MACNPMAAIHGIMEINGADHPVREWQARVIDGNLVVTAESPGNGGGISLRLTLGLPSGMGAKRLAALLMA